MIVLCILNNTEVNHELGSRAIQSDRTAHIELETERVRTNQYALDMNKMTVPYYEVKVACMIHCAYRQEVWSGTLVNTRKKTQVQRKRR